MPNIQKGKIIFDKDDFLGGLHPQYEGVTDVRRQLGGSQLASASAFHPYRSLGYAAPGYDPVAPTGEDAIDNYLKSGVVFDSNIYCTSAGPQLVRMTFDTEPTVTDATVGSNVWPYSINSAANNEVGEDIVVYNSALSSTQASRVFFSWRNDTKWDIGMYYSDSVAIDIDFMTAVASGGGDLPDTEGKDYPHPMEVGDDDILYIGDRNLLHAYDGGTGANGTFEEEVLVLPRGYVIASFARITDYLVVFAYKESAGSADNTYYQGRATAFFYDYLNRDPQYVFDLNDNYTGEAFTLGSTVGVFTQGRTNDLENSGNRSSKMQIFDGTKFDPVFTFSDNVPERGGVFVNDDTVFWNSEGNVYSWGTFFNGLDNVANKLLQGATSSTVSGILMFPTTKFILQSASSSAGGRAIYYGSGTYAEDASFSTTMADLGGSKDQMWRVTEVWVHFAKPSSDGRSLRLGLIDQSQTAYDIISSTENFKDVTESTMVRKYNPEDLSFNDGDLVFSSLNLFGVWNTGTDSSDAPILERVVVFYEPVNIQEQ